MYSKNLNIIELEILVITSTWRKHDFSSAGKFVYKVGAVTFEIEKNNTFKIGMTTTSNKFGALCKIISLRMIHLSFVHFKKLAKIQFLKYRNT